MEGTVNQRIEKLIKDKDISQTELANRLSVSKQTISNWIAGNVQIPLRHVVVLVEEFKWLNVRWLLTGSGTMEDDPAKKGKETPEQSKMEGMVEILKNQLATKDETIYRLNKEIGKLEERLESRKK